MNQYKRTIEIDKIQLLDAFYAGLDGEMVEIFIDYLKNDIKITRDDIQILAESYRNIPGYGEEDYESALLTLGEIFFDD